EETGRLDHHIDAELLPRKLRRVALRQDLDLLFVDGDGIPVDRDAAAEGAVVAVVLEQVRALGGAGEVVDGDDLHLRMTLHQRLGKISPDAAKAVNSDAHAKLQLLRSGLSITGPCGCAPAPDAAARQAGR